MIVVDGAQGEGGGQVLRVSLALAAATGKDVKVTNVRRSRPNPGLATSHALAVQTLAEVTDAMVEGATKGATEVVYRPGAAAGGPRDVHVPTAGSLTLILQTLLPVAVASGKPWIFDLKGGTDVMWSPTWGHFADVHLANVARLGGEVEATLKERGFYPVGGGEATVEIAASTLHPNDFLDRGDLVRIEGVVATAGLPERVAERCEAAARERILTDLGQHVDLRIDRDVRRRPGKGASISLRAVFEEAVLGADAVGKLGMPAEKVGDDAARSLVAEVRAKGAVDVHEADALPLWLALAGGGSFACRGLSDHARTVLDVVPLFMDVRYEVDEAPGRVEVRCA